jgi:hypothetical protein
MGVFDHQYGFGPINEIFLDETPNWLWAARWLHIVDTSSARRRPSLL